MKKQYTLTIISLLLSFQLFAQFGRIKGVVVDKESGEPIISSNIKILELTNTIVQTDNNGIYVITKIPYGNYTVRFAFIGYETQTRTIEVNSDEPIQVNFSVEKKKNQLNEITVSGEKEKARENVNISTNIISQKDLARLPTFGGEPDLVQYLQVLPGVNFSGDQGGQLYIRGGSPVMNKVLLDGLIIYNPFHSIGLFSIFDADLIKTADVSAGGFNVQHGGRISGVIDVSTRDGNRKDFSGKISINPITAKFHIEAPITKFTDGGGSSSYVLSYKTSYLDKTAPILYKNADPENGLPYSFNDLYGKYSFSGSNGSKATFFGFRFDDNSKFNNLNYNWNNVGFGTNLLIIPDGSSTLINIAAGFSNYEIKLTEANGNPRSSGINSFNALFGFTNYFGKDDLKYGFEVVGFNTLYNYKNSTGRNIDQENSNTEACGYIKFKKIIGSRIVIEPGIRAVYYASLSESSIEPRIGAKYNVNSFFRLKGAAGMYSQNLISAVSDQDVVNLFYGFLSSPDDISRNGSLRNTNSRIQTAWHGVFGFEFDILDNNKSKLSLNSEAFYKNFNQIISINRYKIYENDASNINRSDLQKFDYIAEKGLSYGADATLKFENKKLNIWAVYSLTYVTRNDGVVGEYMPHFDRRHNINIVVNQSWGNKTNPTAWTANLRWNFGSGFPFTQTQGLYEKLNFAGGISVNPLVQNGNLGVYYEQINTGRLPYFHRLDVSLSRKIIISKSSVLNITAAATNVYNRENIFYFDILNYKRINQLPFLPTLGFSLTF
ncbi:MAG: carboxypeptidase-like regulatory domain-containing protein [Bacteroidia bacterium]|nr:carboxypeptidase-like regulatory domain-containing protein [Bacteroidia bacterium]